MQSLEIDGVRAEPGTRKRGCLKVGPYFYHRRAYIRRWVLIPFTITRGMQDGPTLAQTAGCHPTEYAGIDATIRLSNAIKPEDLRGTHITLPCMNIPTFFERGYINPIDGKNLSGLFPGRIDGDATITDLIAYRVFNEVVLKADYLLDCHGGDIMESMIWYAAFVKTDDDTEKRSEALARATGWTYLLRYQYPGGLITEAARRGIPSVLFECSQGSKLLETESAAILDGALNVMRHLNMLDGEPKKISGQPGTSEGQTQEIWTESKEVFFTSQGLFHRDVKPGDFVEEGQMVGTVTNWWGDVVETIRAPATGRIPLMVHNPVAYPGEVAIRVSY
jgi:predicted deacylase